MNHTKIECAEYTWNPITGCTPVSSACNHCYAKSMAQRLAGRHGYDKEQSFRPTIHWERFNDKLPRRPSLIFVGSMGDIFHQSFPFELYVRLIEVIKNHPEHYFRLLTKRPQNITRAKITNEHRCPLQNIWLGVTVESQEWVHIRIPQLLSVSMYINFVNVEPMLGPIDLTYYLNGNFAGKKLDWVICGAETGPHARWMDPQWAIDLKNQCLKFNIPFFFKKLSKGCPVVPELEVRQYPINWFKCRAERMPEVLSFQEMLSGKYLRFQKTIRIDQMAVEVEIETRLGLEDLKDVMITMGPAGQVMLRTLALSDDYTCLKNTL